MSAWPADRAAGADITGPSRSPGTPDPITGLGTGLISGSDRLARAVVAAVTDPGDPQVSALVDRVGAREMLDRLGAGELGTGDPAAAGFARYRRRLALCEPEQIVAATLRAGARVIVPGDAEWVAGLADLAQVRSSQGWGGTPVALWARGPGRAGADDPGAVAVVGSREATAYGSAVASEMAAGLAERGWSVISGGAYGIDGAAHRGALAVAGQTVAVLAGGIDVCYPRGHAALLDRIGEEGLLLTEAPPGASPTRRAFLIRNRLIAALSAGTVVVEAALRSGALNTATWANGCLRVVMAVPGPVSSPLSAGTHRLIRDAEATLVADADEVRSTLLPGSAAFPGPDRSDPQQPSLLPVPGVGPGSVDPREGLDEQALLVVDALAPIRPTGLAAVLATTGLSPGQALAALGRLCGAGVVSSDDGGWRLSATTRAWLRQNATRR